MHAAMQASPRLVRRRYHRRSVAPAVQLLRKAGERPPGQQALRRHDLRKCVRKLSRSTMEHPRHVALPHRVGPALPPQSWHRPPCTQSGTDSLSLKGRARLCAGTGAGDEGALPFAKSRAARRRGDSAESADCLRLSTGASCGRLHTRATAHLLCCSAPQYHGSLVVSVELCETPRFVAGMRQDFKEQAANSK